MADSIGIGSHIYEIHEAQSTTDMPTPQSDKHRRSLAGSIISTALNAALIGTAVGFTVYRLWRDRAKQPERLPPPPPYDQGEWTPEAQTSPLLIAPAPTPIPTTSSPPLRTRRSRHAVGTTSKRTAIPSHRRSRGARGLPHASSAIIMPLPHPHPHPEPNFRTQQDEQSRVGGVEARMDWITRKLSELIEEGRKALNREVVVLSDAKEDEVDDGSGAWEVVEEEEEEEEEEVPSNPQPAPNSISRSSSTKHAYTRRPLPPVSPNPNNTFDESIYPSSAPSPIPIPTPTTPRRSHFRGLSAPTSTSAPTSAFDQDDNTTSTSFYEDERTWTSPELRESMERARARAKMNMNMKT